MENEWLYYSLLWDTNETLRGFIAHSSSRWNLEGYSSEEFLWVKLTCENRCYLYFTGPFRDRDVNDDKVTRRRSAVSWIGKKKKGMKLRLAYVSHYAPLRYKRKRIYIHIYVNTHMYNGAREPPRIYTYVCVLQHNTWIRVYYIVQNHICATPNRCKPPLHRFSNVPVIFTPLCNW